MTYEHSDDVSEKPADSVERVEGDGREARQLIRPPGPAASPNPKLAGFLAELARTSSRPLPIEVVVRPASAPGAPAEPGGRSRDTRLSVLAFGAGACAMLVCVSLFPSRSVVVIGEEPTPRPARTASAASGSPTDAPTASPSAVPDPSPIAAAAAASNEAPPAPKATLSRKRLPFPPFVSRSTPPVDRADAPATETAADARPPDAPPTEEASEPGAAGEVVEVEITPEPRVSTSEP